MPGRGKNIHYLNWPRWECHYKIDLAAFNFVPEQFRSVNYFPGRVCVSQAIPQNSRELA